MAKGVLPGTIGGAVSMIHQYAVDPDSFFQADGFWSLLKDFGIAQGRVIVECPERSWRKTMEASLCRARAELGPVAFLRLTERWTELTDRKGFVHRKNCRPGGSATRWLAQVLPEHHREPFHALLSNESDGTVPELLTKQDIDLGHERWKPEIQRIVPRNSAALAECIGPLGKISNDILFIDPYFSEDKKWRESLVQALWASRADDRHFQRIEVHTSEYNDRERDQSRGQRIASKLSILRDTLRISLPRELPPGISVEFFVWKEKEKGDRYHRRYVLTERGGSYFEGGLDRGAEGHTTDVGLLSDAVRQERWDQYQRTTAAFDLVGEPFVIKSLR
jgi:hypothetical protein